MTPIPKVGGLLDPRSQDGLEVTTSGGWRCGISVLWD